MERRVSATNACGTLGEVMSMVADGDTVIIERSGEPFAAIVPVYWYQKWMEDREARFAVIDRIRSNVPDYPQEEVEADIAEAIAAARAGWRPEEER